MGLEPYLLSSIRTLYETTFKLSAAQTHKVAKQRLVPPEGDENVRQAAQQAYEAYQAGFGEPSFTLSEVVDCYPLHPVASQSLETVVQKYLGTADGLLRLVSAPRGRGGLGSHLERDCRQLIGPVEIVPFLRSLLDSHPQASPFFTEVEDFYQRKVDI